MNDDDEIVEITEKDFQSSSKIPKGSTSMKSKCPPTPKDDDEIQFLGRAKIPAYFKYIQFEKLVSNPFGN